MSANLLNYGDNLDVLSRHVKDDPGAPGLAYLANMAPRLVELRRVLKPTGSIYLHCDSTAFPSIFNVQSG